MNKIFSSGKLTKADHVRIFKGIFIASNATALLLFIFLRILFYNTPITLEEDMLALLNTLIIGSVVALGLYMILLIIEIADHIFSKKEMRLLPALQVVGISIFSILLVYLSSCNVGVVSGVHKDFNTGVTTHYKNMEAGKTLLIMNNEVLNHTDIPLGENFILINDEVKGLVEKDGKVSAGCELNIKDKQGNQLLHEADLFKGEDVFLKENATALKCTISTGKPMKWEELYDVTVTFWDKYGTGKLENKFSIRVIDIP